MAKKVYTLNYASYSEDDMEVYAECIMVSENEDTIKQALENDFKITLNEDFDNYDEDDLIIVKTNDKFVVSDRDKFKIITETISYKEVL